MHKNMQRIGAGVAFLSIAALGLTACGGSNNPTSDSSGSASGDADTKQLSGTLSGSGASSQEAAIAAWQNGFTSTQSGAQVQYNPVGSGAGRKAFLAGQVAFAGSDAALAGDEQTQAQKQCGDGGALNIPAYVSPVAVTVNLDGIKEVNLDGPTIAKIFAGEITQWDDKAITEQNPDADLPSTKITPIHRSDDSGTTENFTEYLDAVAKDEWGEGVVETWPKGFGGESAQGTSGVVKLAGSTEGSIAYADLSAVGDDLGKVAVKVGDEYQAPTEEAAAKNVELAEKVEGTEENDLALELDRTSQEAGQYPIVLVSYHVYCSTYKDQNTADLVKAFGTYVVSDEGQKAAEEAAGSAPLTETTAEQAKTAIDSITVAK
ncbi:MAG: phosphate ABC transporter substrate-binding protein PstS [Galactobacter sp.]|uniref:phosphate ABC transporter substrate-binding protein PstS n=1 Tax=Galactobacter sp. TaxID=2676125 RepID=UPI0025BB10A0|nr:phosphate ABC transporter substrate-binding protein PstS [Galactobacter sp.]